MEEGTPYAGVHIRGWTCTSVAMEIVSNQKNMKAATGTSGLLTL